MIDSGRPGMPSLELWNLLFIYFSVSNKEAVGALGR